MRALAVVDTVVVALRRLRYLLEGPVLRIECDQHKEEGGRRGLAVCKTLASEQRAKLLEELVLSSGEAEV